MIRSPHSPKLSPADRAHLKVLQQEARCERLERQVEREMSWEASIREVMEGESIPKPHVMRNSADQWECMELARLNRNRPASRICFSLPAACYDARRCNRYIDRDGT